MSAWLLSHLCLNRDTGDSVLKSELIGAVLHLLDDKNQDIAEKALWVLTNLTICIEHSHQLIEYNAVDIMINIIKRSNYGLITLAAVPLRNLLHKDTCGEYLDNQRVLCHSGAIQHISKLLGSRSPALTNEVIISLTSIIHVLSIYHPLIRRIIAISGVLSQLISFLSSPSSSLQVKEQVAKILINLSLTEETERPILDSGAIMPLVDSIVSISSPLSLKSLSISCLANLTSNADIRKVLRSKYLIEGLIDILKDRQSLNSQLLEAISLSIANLCIDDMCRYIIAESECDAELSKHVDYPHAQVRESIIKALDNIRVPVSPSIGGELIRDDMSDLDLWDVGNGGSAGGSAQSSPRAGMHRQSPNGASLNLGSPRLRRADKDKAVQSPEEASTFRRGKIIKEIIDTERSFKSALSICIRVCYNPLVVTSATSPILPKEVVTKIFRNIDKIYRVNCEFLKKLMSLSAEPSVGEIVDAFVWLWDNPLTTSAYRYYIKKFNKAMDLIHDNRVKVPKFKEFLDKCQFSDHCKSETLESYLIRPIQRLPRYMLLLTDLLSHTHDKDDKAALETVLARTKTIIDQLNESKRTAENKEKAKMLKEKVVGLQEGFQMVCDERRLLKEGLMMESRQKKVSKYRHLILFNDFLFFTKPTRNKYVVLQSMPLLEVKVVDMNNNNDLEYSFRILWSNREDRNENGIVISTSKLEEKEDWMREIREASNALKRANLNLKMNNNVGGGGLLSTSNGNGIGNSLSQPNKSPRGVHESK
ncbi:hypothetical protein SAMD00019534_120500 [Acytostelium subglobosum LB1]|uniref:hypothetical protein n=1 Tax=Acytostelium subglobosum LB1 TaxID=1410327 RepID=UPI000644DDA2|nr:hypothetical protein SAMD00019534_120500 [Acytostelium subglobosum LB1]GAM28874.1 hypothetical protein SAMD00019534_120500 [Acytostelium subglobosum LB1]|eukprot:XP_012748246.1 hypothetical protein SAMD00019534_120500 [Acytostelium subglobosum LB1]